MKSQPSWRCLGAIALAGSLLTIGRPDQKLRLKTGDVVHIAITVASASNTYAGDFLVQSDGSIYGVGFTRVNVAGRTLGESQSLLRNALRRLVNPQEVFLTLKSEVARRVFIVGSPGGGPASGTVGFARFTSTLGRGRRIQRRGSP